MIKVHLDTKLFTAVEEENGNVTITFKKKVREALGLQYPHIAVEVEQGNALDSYIGIAEDCLETA